MSDPTLHRCWECGRPVTPDDSDCPSCGSVQEAICETCGTTCSVYADACPSCGHAREAFAWRRSPARRRIVVFLLLVAAVAGGLYGFRMWRYDDGRRRRIDFVEASIAFERHRNEEARAGFSRYLSRWGDDPKARYMLALSLRRLGRDEEAVAAAERALELRPRYPDAALFLARRARESGDSAQALDFARRALASGPAPTDEEAHLLAGRILAEPPHVDLTGAVRHLRTAVRLGADSPDVLLLLADLAGWKLSACPGSESLGEIQRWLERAREGIQSKLADSPVDPDLLFLRARVEYRLEEIDLLRGERRPEFASSVNNLELALRHSNDTLSRERAPKELLLGKLRWRRRGERSGRPVLDALLESEPDAPILAELAEFYLQQGAELAAIDVLAQAIRRFPTDPVFRLLETRRHLFKGDLHAAASSIADARTTLPRQPDLALLDGLIRRWRGDLSGAEEILRELVERTGPCSEADLHLVDLLLEVGRIGEASERLALAGAAGDPDDALALFRESLQGKLDLRIDDGAGAIGKLGRVVGSLDADAFAHHLLAQAHARRGEHDLAVMETDAVIHAAGRSYELVLARGRAQLAAGEPELAAKDADEALEIRPGAEAALLLRARARPATSREDLERSLAGEGPRVRTRVALAERLRDAGEAGRARELLEEAWRRAETEPGRLVVTEATGDFDRHLEEFPGDVGARVARAVRHLDAGRLEEAARDARRAIADDPDGIEARLVLFETCFDGLGPAPGGEEAAREVADGIAALGTDVAALAYARGKLALARGELAEALERFETAVGSRPDRPRFRFAHGVASHLAGDAEEARAALRSSGAAGAAVLARPRADLLLDLARRALARDPGSASGIRWLRLALGAIQDPSERIAPALALLAATKEPDPLALAALEAAPDSGIDEGRAGPGADGLFLAGLAREREGDTAKAEALYRRALALRDGHVAAATNLSLILSTRGGDAADEAVALARAAHGEGRGRPEVSDALERALRARAGLREAEGRTEEALRDRAEADRLSESRTSR